MLVLSRDVNESAVIDLPDGRLAEVKVLEVRGNKVRLGFTAPSSVTIHRREIWVSINGLFPDPQTIREGKPIERRKKPA